MIHRLSLTVLILCALASSALAEAFLWAGGPQKTLMVCSSMKGSLSEVVTSFSQGMRRRGIVCNPSPAVNGVTFYLCEDKQKNNLMFAAAMTEKKCLLSFLDYLRMLVETDHPLPEFPKD